MDSKLAWGLAICLMLPLSVGCTSDSGVVRGQSPSPGPQYGAFPPGGSLHATCPSCQSGYCDAHAGYGGTHPLHAAHGGRGHGPHHLFSPRLRGLGTGWYPTHYHGYHYDAPDRDEMVYPPQNQPAAVVQYPYYTLKGPDDFFFPPLQ